MITPIGTLNINQIAERKYDLLVSTDDVKALARNERNKAIDDFVERLKYECKQTITTSSAFVRGSFDEVVDEIAGQLKGGAE